MLRFFLIPFIITFLSENFSKIYYFQLDWLVFDTMETKKNIYNKLHFKQHRFCKLKVLVNSENIEISVNGIRSLIQKFHKTNSVKDQVINSRGNSRCKVNYFQFKQYFSLMHFKLF